MSSPQATCDPHEILEAYFAQAKAGREASETPPSSPPMIPTTPTPANQAKSTTPSRKRAKLSSASSSPTNSPKTPRASSSTFTSAQRAAILDDVIAAGARAIDLGRLADKHGVKKSQLVDQLKPNRSNLRAKAVKAVQGDV